MAAGDADDGGEDAHAAGLFGLLDGDGDGFAGALDVIDDAAREPGSRRNADAEDAGFAGFGDVADDDGDLG
jgi:hypothetical protein